MQKAINSNLRFVLFNPMIGPLSGATTPGQNGPESDGNKGVFCIPQSSSITETSQSDCLVSYPGHSLGGFYPSAEVQSVYSTAPTDWAIYIYNHCVYIYIYNITGKKTQPQLNCHFK